MRYSSRFLAIGAVLAVASSACSYDHVYRGTYIWGAEVDAFRPCDSIETYWASYSWGGVELREFYEAKKREPYAAVYVEFRGHLLDEVRDGFALDYDGLIRISEVLAVSDTIPSDCRPAS